MAVEGALPAVWVGSGAIGPPGSKPPSAKAAANRRVRATDHLGKRDELVGIRDRGLGPEGRLVPARVISEDVLPWRRSKLVSAGTLRGVRNGAAVTSHRFTADAGSEAGVSDVILQNVAVRGIDQIADEDRNKPQVVRTVTVEVSPEEAQKLALAMQVGQLSLALRNFASVEEAKVRTIRVSDLANSRKKTASEPRYSPPKVRVRRGSDLSVVSVPR